MPAFKIIARTVVGKRLKMKLTKFLFLIVLLVGVWMTSHGDEDVLSEILKQINFALEVDKSTDITNKAQLLAFV
jgi:hypothetical protein